MTPIDKSHSEKKRVIILGSQQQATVNVVGSIESLSIIMHLMNVQTTTDICLCIKRLKVQHFELLINLKDMFIYYLYSKLLKVFDNILYRLIFSVVILNCFGVTFYYNLYFFQFLKFIHHTFKLSLCIYLFICCWN